MIKVPISIQMQNGENGVATLHMILSYYKKFLSIEDIRQYCPASRSITDVKQLCVGANHFGLVTEVKENVTPEELKSMNFPVVVTWNKRYYAIVKGFRHNKVYINDAAKGTYKITEEAFFRRFGGKVIVMSPGQDFVPEGKPVSSLSIVWSRAKHNKQATTKILIYNLIMVGLTIFMLIVTREMMDKVISQGNTILVIPLGLVLIILLVLKIFTSVINLTDSLKESRKMSAQSGSRLYKTILNLPIKFFEDHTVGDIVNRINTNMKIDQSFFRVMLPNIINCLVTLFYLVMMFVYQPIFAIMFIVLEVLNILANILIRSKTSVASKSLNVVESNISSFTLNGVNMIETIKTSGTENNFFSTWTQSQNRFDESRQELARLDSVAVLIASIHRILSTFVLIFGGVWLMTEGYISIGVLTIFQSVLNNMQSSLNQAIGLTSEIQTMRTCVERVDDILDRKVDEEVELSGDPEPIRGHILINNISFCYTEGDRPAVENFSLDIKEGESVALVGHTGCGKSTVIKMLTGLYKPTSGDIFYDGKNINEIPSSVFHSYVASVDQDTMTFDGSVSDNIKLWDEYISDYTMVEASKDARIYDSIVGIHGGFDKDIAENGRNYSGGEIQRIEIARALSHNPSVLILDEFTSALDVITEKEVFDSIKKRNATCVIAVHRLSSIMKCDRVVVMEKGKIIEMGEPHALYAKNGAFTKLIER